jgi:hypothetical protein
MEEHSDRIIEEG